MFFSLTIKKVIFVANFNEKDGRSIHTYTFLQAAMQILRILLHHTPRAARAIHPRAMQRITRAQTLYKR